jgi:hypothetical protein
MIMILKNVNNIIILKLNLEKLLVECYFALSIEKTIYNFKFYDNNFYLLLLHI